MNNGHSGMEAPTQLLATMPDARREWGAAMLAELPHIRKPTIRWRGGVARGHRFVGEHRRLFFTRHEFGWSRRAE